MAVEVNSKKSSRTAGLATTLATAFVILSLVLLLLASIFQLALNLQAQQGKVAAEQRVIASEAALEVSDFVERTSNTLESTAKVGSRFVDTVEEQRSLLEVLLNIAPTIREASWLDDRGQEIVKVSRLAVVTEDDLINRANSDLFIQTSQDQRYLSSVFVDERTNEPLITIAVPVTDDFGKFVGTLAANVSLKFMWDLVASLSIGQQGHAYVVDRQGNLIAFRDTLRVVRGENVSHLDEVSKFLGNYQSSGLKIFSKANISTGINGDQVVSSHVTLEKPEWAVVIELPIKEAYQAGILALSLSAGGVLFLAILAGISGSYLARRLATPLLNLTETVTQIASGDVKQRAVIEGPSEIAQLAEAFNSMTNQLQESIDSLEQRVADRTRRLEIVATLGEKLSSILNLDELLDEVVDQVRDRFGYYHAHIYLLDDRQERLVVAAGTGIAGEEMKAKGHNIPLIATTSLVARTARNGEIVRVDNVRETEDWLPNPLLPDTFSEMAVPILLEGQVVGVLDVQENKIGGLDESDAILLRSLANQVAVAIRNARLFNEVETALADVRVAQQQYLEESWEKAKIMQRNAAHYHYASPDATPLAESTLSEANQQALCQKQPFVMRINGTTNADPIVTSIKLRDQVIGALQLYPQKNDHIWTEDDLALVEAIVEELAQTAENLRLFEDTRERANYERTVGEISEKLRAAPNLNALLETASRELGQRLGVPYTVLEMGIDPDRKIDLSES